MPKINRAISKKNTPSISDEKRDKMHQEISAVYQRYYEEEGLEAKMVSVDLKIPFGDIVLVSGLWLLARKEN